MRRSRLVGTILGFFVAGLVVLFALATRKQTRFAPGFTQAAFARIATGQSTKQVLDLLGEPLSRLRDEYPELWCYGDRPPAVEVESKQWMVWSEYKYRLPKGPPCLAWEDGRARESLRDTDRKLTGAIGKSQSEVSSQFGPPKYLEPSVTRDVWYYSGPSKDNVSFDYHAVVFDTAGVVVRTFQDTVWE